MSRPRPLAANLRDDSYCNYGLFILFIEVFIQQPLGYMRCPPALLHMLPSWAACPHTFLSMRGPAGLSVVSQH